MLCDFFASVFGTWPNLTQGLIGSAMGSGLGVFGAYWVATRQLGHQAKAQREAAGGHAAGGILESLLPLHQHLERLTKLDPDRDYDEDGVTPTLRNNWRGTCSTYEVAVILRSHLLPSRVSSPLEALIPRLEAVLSWTWHDDHGGLVSCWVTVEADAVLAEVKEAQSTLVRYARKALGDAR